ncbi:hypothetical protein CDL12_23001 [Handroanthus impetiginosus]|uniref:Uncharacterized protein n=1 Tax=Handroanthus impetiginosus TaxID=429701 RepID=A0A2G9GGN8_9LAMI|nr:hypothetical protein CDL12_23001 [Handroanthus impetiginosus]
MCIHGEESVSKLNTNTLLISAESILSIRGQATTTFGSWLFSSAILLKGKGAGVLVFFRKVRVSFLTFWPGEMNQNSVYI